MCGRVYVRQTCDADHIGLCGCGDKVSETQGHHIPQAMSHSAQRDESFLAPTELVQALRKYGSVITHSDGTVLFTRGAKAHGLFLLQTGAARLSIPRAMDCEVGPGSLLGVPGTLSKGVYSLSAELIEESQVLFVPSERVAALLKDHPEVGFQMVQVLSREIQSLRQRIVELNQK